MKKSETIEVLRAARALIVKPGAWLQRASAWSPEAGFTSSENPAACRFCATGALRRVTRDWGDALRALNAALPVAWLLRPAAKGVDDPESRDFDPAWRAVPRYNDEPGVTQDDVLALFDLAIELLGPAAVVR